MARAHCMAVARDPTTGAALTSATANVYNPGTVTPISATIFDKNGNTLTNPLTSDPTTGLLDFYLNVAQEVDLVVSKGGFTTRTYSNVPVIDDASFDLTALLTTTGDIAYASANNTPARLGIAANNSMMYAAGGIPAWNTNLQVNSSGNVGVGQAPDARIDIITGGTNRSGATQWSIYAGSTGTSSGTTEITAFQGVPATAAAAFTCATVTAFHAANPLKGAGSTITSAYGLLVDTITAGTTNIGVQVAAPTAGAGSWAIKTAGDSLFGSGSIATNATSGFIFISSCAGAPTGTPANDSSGTAMVLDSTNSKIWVRVAGSWKGVVVA